MKRVLMVKRKGFNYYTDYTELYLHRAFQNYGYSIVREKAKSDFSVIVYISETEKYMKMTSLFFDDLDEKDITDLCSFFSKAFKSEVTMTEITEHTYESIYAYEFMISKTYSAYDEPSFLFDSPPKLEIRTWDVNFRTNTDYSMSFVSVGGKFSGITVTFDFNDTINDLKLSDARISVSDNKHFIRREIVFNKVDNLFKAYVDSLEINKGVNQKSAVLRGKQKANEEEHHGFWLGVLPVSKKMLF